MLDSNHSEFDEDDFVPFEDSRQPTEKEVEEYLISMARIAFRVLAQESRSHTIRSARDLVNAALVKMMAGAQKGRLLSDLSVGEWRVFISQMRTIMHNRLIDNGRARAKRPIPETGLSPTEKGGQNQLDWHALKYKFNALSDQGSREVLLDPVETLAIAETMERLHQKSPMVALIFTLRLEGYSIDEVSEMFDISPSTVKRRYRKATEMIEMQQRPQ